MNRGVYLGAVGAALITAVVVGAWVITSNERKITPPVLPAQVDKVSSQTVSLESQWQWRDVSAMQSQRRSVADASEEIPFDVVIIHDSLAKVQIDASGNVIVDESALPALKKAFQSLGGTVSPEELSQLQALVKIGLPGKAGEQVANLLGQFNQYQLAREQAAQTESEPSEALEPDTAEGARRDLESLVAMRRDYFDQRTALDLFGRDEAHQRYLLSRREIQLSNSSEEEKQLAMSELQREFHDGVYYLSEADRSLYDELKVSYLSPKTGVSEQLGRQLDSQLIGLVAAGGMLDEAGPRWQERVRQYLKERETIMAAGLSEKDKVSQIDWLMQQHFSETEITTSQDYLPTSTQSQ